MVLKHLPTESIDYHMNHIGAIRINKDRLINEYNVDIQITKKRFGEYQTIDVSGYSKNIRDVKKKLNEIIEIASYEYNQFRQRKKDRQRASKQFNPSDIKKNRLIKYKQTKQYHNPFDVLAVDEDLNDETDNEYNSEYPKLLKKCSTSNVSWGDMCDDDE